MARRTDTETDAGKRAVPTHASVQTGDGGLLVYDRENPSAWLQSDATVEIRE